MAAMSDRKRPSAPEDATRREFLRATVAAGLVAAVRPAAAANAVAALHLSGISCPRSVEVADVQLRLLDLRRLLPQITPSCREALEPLVDRLMVQGNQLGDQPVAVLHGFLLLLV